MTLYKDINASFAAMAAADLSAETNLHRLVTMSDDWEVNLCGSNGIAVGVLTELNTSNARADARNVTVQFGGIAKVRLGGTVAAGGRVKSAADGLGVAASGAGITSIGIALAGGDSGEIIPVAIMPSVTTS